MREIPLTQGLTAKVDDDDYDYLSQWNWCASDNGGRVYAVTWHKEKLISMHRLLLDYTGALDIDHVNHDGCDNRRENLRIVTRTVNNLNRRVPPKNIKVRETATGAKRYDARVQWNYVSIHLGTYETEDDAKEAVRNAIQQIIKGSKEIQIKKARNRWEQPTTCYVDEKGIHRWSNLKAVEI